MNNDKIFVINRVRPEYTQYISISEAKEFFFGTRLTDFSVLFSDGTFIEELTAKDLKKFLKPQDISDTIMNLKNGDEFTWNGQAFIFSVYGEFHGGSEKDDRRVFLTTKETNNYHGYQENEIRPVHFRNDSYIALFSRQEFIDALTSGKYEIS